MMNKSPEFFDAVVVGAGPAGCTLSIYLALAGYKICLIEKKQFPLDKACGEGIMPTGVSILKETSVLQKIPKDKIQKFSKVRYTTKNTFATAKLQEGPGAGIRRTDLSLALHKRLLEISNIHIFENCKFENYFLQNKLVFVQTSTLKFTTRILIGADGLHSKVARAAGLFGNPQKFKRWGSTVHFEDNKNRDFVEVIPKNKMEAYITPCGLNSTCVAFLWQFKPVQTSNAQNPVQHLLDQFPELKNRFNDKNLKMPTLSLGPFKQKRKNIISDGVVLLGDAAGYLDAITGEGISLALESSKELSQILIDIFSKPNDPNATRSANQKTYITKKELIPWRKKYKQKTFSYYLITSLALRIFSNQYLTQKFIRAMNKSPELFSKILSINMGTIRVSKIRFKEIVKILVA